MSNDKSTDSPWVEGNAIDFYPPALRQAIDNTLGQIYQPINNGVYRTGFAASQAAYETAVTELFQALETWENILADQRYLCGSQITLADWCLFTTLFRFDLAYYGLFKCNLKQLVDSPNLWNYCRELYQYPDAQLVCSIDHVKQLYYAGLPELNPTRIVPAGPEIDFELPHNRQQVGRSACSQIPSAIPIQGLLVLSVQQRSCTRPLTSFAVCNSLSAASDEQYRTA